MSKRRRILSGIQPSGTIHIGNYFGAVENWVRLMKDYDCFFTIVDLHAITVTYDPALLPGRVWDAALDNMAAGLDPDKCTIFVQSHVPEHTELCWLLNCVTPLGELGRMTQFKEKSERERENVTAGLLNYPILRPPTSSSTRPTPCPWGRTRPSIWSSPVRWPAGSTAASATISRSRRP